MTSYCARNRYQTPSGWYTWTKFLPGRCIVLLLLAVIPVSLFGQTQPGLSIVKRVISGDTIKMGDGRRVRLIGVDTPETKHPNRPAEYFGKEATAFTRRMVEGKRVRLKYDPTNAQVRHKNRHGYTLAYVFLEDGTFLNAEIIERGYGFAYTQFPFRYLEAFRRIERDARASKRGLWKK